MSFTGVASFETSSGRGAMPFACRIAIEISRTCKQNSGPCAPMGLYLKMNVIGGTLYVGHKLTNEFAWDAALLPKAKYHGGGFDINKILPIYLTRCNDWIIFLPSSRVAYLSDPTNLVVLTYRAGKVLTLRVKSSAISLQSSSKQDVPRAPRHLVDQLRGESWINEIGVPLS